MICNHRKYDLGDKHIINFKNINSWAELEKQIRRSYNVAVMLPLYLYDHSGITMNTTGFSCPWDSGKVGYIIATKEMIRAEYGIKRINKGLLEKIEQYLIGEVKIYDQYISGDVYNFLIEDMNGNHIDSCGGFYGSDIKTNGMLEHIRDKELIDLIELEG
jgi:hypothetical protein